MEGAVAEPNVPLAEEQRKWIEKVLKDGGHNASMLALMAKKGGEWKIVALTFPK